MRKLLIIILLFIFVSCVNENEEITESDLNTTLTIKDIEGKTKTIFKSGEEFLVEFKMLNKSNTILKYSTSSPIVSFSIYKDGENIANSYDYYAYILDIVEGKLYPNNILKESWKGPNTDARIGENKKILLEKGDYVLKVNHPIKINNKVVKKNCELVFYIQ